MFDILFPAIWGNILTVKTKRNSSGTFVRNVLCHFSFLGAIFYCLLTQSENSCITQEGFPARTVLNTSIGPPIYYSTAALNEQ